MQAGLCKGKPASILAAGRTSARMFTYVGSLTKRKRPLYRDSSGGRARGEGDTQVVRRWMEGCIPKSSRRGCEISSRLSQKRRMDRVHEERMDLATSVCAGARIVGVSLSVVRVGVHAICFKHSASTRGDDTKCKLLESEIYYELHCLLVFAIDK